MHGPKSAGCPYLKSDKIKAQRLTKQRVEDTLLQTPHDVEELGALGRLALIDPLKVDDLAPISQKHKEGNFLLQYQFK